MRITLTALEGAFPELAPLPADERARLLRQVRLQGRVPALVCPSAALFTLAGYVQVAAPHLFAQVSSSAAGSDARFWSLWLAFTLGAGLAAGLIALTLRDTLISRALRFGPRTPRCIRCRHDLTGLPVREAPDGPWLRCPECGLATSLHAAALTEADLDPRWPALAPCH